MNQCAVHLKSNEAMIYHCFLFLNFPLLVVTLGLFRENDLVNRHALFSDYHVKQRYQFKKDVKVNPTLEYSLRLVYDIQNRHEKSKHHCLGVCHKVAEILLPMLHHYVDVHHDGVPDHNEDLQNHINDNELE